VSEKKPNEHADRGASQNDQQAQTQMARVVIIGLLQLGRMNFAHEARLLRYAKKQRGAQRTAPVSDNRYRNAASKQPRIPPRQPPPLIRRHLAPNSKQAHPAEMRPSGLSITRGRNHSRLHMVSPCCCRGVSGCCRGVANGYTGRGPPQRTAR
jgi:hypothetical protein